MCTWGTDTILLVPIPAELSHNGQFHWAWKGVDSCIADIVQALNTAGILTSQSCCGHGKGNGLINLHDGRVLLIKQDDGDYTLPDDKQEESKHV
jgi:hypothetical protein